MSLLMDKDMCTVLNSAGFSDYVRAFADMLAEEHKEKVEERKEKAEERKEEKIEEHEKKAEERRSEKAVKREDRSEERIEMTNQKEGPES